MRIFPQESERVESGAIRFGDDWPGLFMRGDDAFGLSLSILNVCKHVKQIYEKQKMPIELRLALMELAGVYDMVQDQVCGRVAKEDISNELHDVKDTIHYTNNFPTEQTNE